MTDDRERSLIDEVHAAAGSGDSAALFRLLDGRYLGANDDVRDALRAAVRADRQLDQMIWDLMMQQREQTAARSDHAAALRCFLLALSVSYHYDSRDMLMGLAAEWRGAAALGIDPAPHFHEIAAASSCEETHLAGGSAQAMMSIVADCPEYRDQLRY